MAYIKQNFTDGQTLKAEHLNHIEDGIVNAVNNNENILSQAKEYTDSQRIAYDDRKSLTICEEDGLVAAPFIESESDLIGLKVEDTFKGRIFLTTPTKKPTLDSNRTVMFNMDDLYITYQDYNGMISKPCLIVDVTPMMCPTFFKDENKYQALIYAFETVTDTMGLGITLSKGWHAINSSTFAHEPFDPTVHFVIFIEEAIKDYAKQGCEEYLLKELFSLKETISYTVNQENIYYYQGDYGVSFLDTTDITNKDNCALFASFLMYKSSNGAEVYTVFPWKTITIHEGDFCAIDPKFLPEGGFGYVIEGDINLIEEQTATNLDVDCLWLGKRIGFENYWEPELVLGREYTVTVNGKVYKSVAKKLNDSYYYLGDIKEQDYLGLGLWESDIAEANIEHTGEPWCVIWQLGIETDFFMFDGTKEVTLSITYRGEKIVPIDSKFLPEPIKIVTLTFADIFGTEEDNMTLASLIAGGTKLYDNVQTDFWDKVKSVRDGTAMIVETDDSLGCHIADIAPNIVYNEYGEPQELIMNFEALIPNDDFTDFYPTTIKICLINVIYTTFMYVEVNQSTGKQVTIDLNKYGIDIAELILSGGGTAQFTGNNITEMWNIINRESDIVFKYTFEGATASFSPLAKVLADGHVELVSVKFMVVYNDMVMDISIVFTSHRSNGEYIGANVIVKVNN